MRSVSYRRKKPSIRKLKQLRSARQSAQRDLLNCRRKKERVDELELKGVQELERVSGLTSEQAKEELLRSVEDDVKVDVAKTLQRT